MFAECGDRHDRTKLLNEQARKQRHCRLLSVVVPCFNEEEAIVETHRQLVAVLGDAVPIELIYVDDGSQDTTLDILRDLQGADERVRVVVLSRNFGKEAALLAGLANAAGDAATIVDADLQNPPEVVLDMLRRWQDGADVAYGVRTRREDETAFKHWTAVVFYRLLGKLSGTAVQMDAGDFRLMDRIAVDALLAMPEQHRFARGLVAWSGFRQEPVPFRRPQRAAGETKYPLRVMLRLALDGLLSFSRAPLRLAFWLGLFAFALGLLGIVYALAERLFAGVSLGGDAWLLVAMLLLGGVQLAFIGVLGEYIGRIYGEVKRRPLYFVQEKLGFPPAEGRPDGARGATVRSATAAARCGTPPDLGSRVPR